MQRIDFVYATPIPVGHRVQVTWFKHSTHGMFGEKTEDKPYEPAIKDLDTGIEYVSDFSFPNVGSPGKQPDIPLTVSDNPGPGLEVESVLVGRVTYCRIVTVRGYSTYDVQTTLVIEPEK